MQRTDDLEQTQPAQAENNLHEWQKLDKSFMKKKQEKDEIKRKTEDLSKFVSYEGELPQDLSLKSSIELSINQAETFDYK